MKQVKAYDAYENVIATIKSAAGLLGLRESD